MSWLFSSNSEKPSKQSLGFDLTQVSDVSSIILAPGALDLSRLHPLAGLDKGIEYLDLEDDQLTDLENGLSIIAARNWRDNLCYGTGTMYAAELCVLVTNFFVLVMIRRLSVRAFLRPCVRHAFAVCHKIR